MSWNCVFRPAESFAALLRIVLRLSQNWEKRMLLSSCLCAHPSVRPYKRNNSAPTGRIFVTFDIWVVFRKSVEKIPVSLKPDNNWYLTWRPIYRGAVKSLARPGRKQANVSVRMAWISFGALPCRGKKLDDSSRLDVIEIAPVPDMLPSLYPSWSG